MVQRAIDAGAYVTIAHPEWYSMTTDEARSVAHAHGVEVYNHSCAISSNRGSGIAVADTLLNDGHRLSFTATDDSHFQPLDHGGGWVMVAADDLTPEAIVASLKDGRHYSSTGPVINYIALEDDTLIVDSSAAETMIVSAQGHLALNKTGPNLTYAEFDLSGLKSSYFRVTIIDRAGGIAWSNPYFFDDLNMTTEHKDGLSYTTLDFSQTAIAKRPKGNNDHFIMPGVLQRKWHVRRKAIHSS